MAIVSRPVNFLMMAKGSQGLCWSQYGGHGRSDRDWAQGLGTYLALVMTPGRLTNLKAKHITTS